MFSDLLYELKNKVTKERFNRSLLFIPDLVISLTYHCNLNCDYCYVRGLLKDTPYEMSMINFNRILDWLAKQNKMKIVLFGGEPTYHSKFKEILDTCEHRGFRIGIITNNLFVPETLKKLDRNYVKFIQVNYNHPSFYTREQFKLFHDNLEHIKKQKIKIILRYNMQEKYVFDEYVLKGAKKYNSEVMFGITFKGYSGNKYLTYEDKEYIKNRLLRFAHNAKRNRVCSYLSGPVPRCLFNKREWNFLKKYSQASTECHACEYGKFNSGARIVNPDLSVFGCFHIFTKAKNIFDFNDLRQLFEYFHEPINKLKWERPLFPGCKDCELFNNKICQGACLGAKN